MAVAAVRLYAEPLGPRRLAAILLASFGMVLVVLGPGATDSNGVDPLGMLFALGAAACQTGYALVASRGFASVPTFQAATLLRGFSLLVYVLLLIPLLVLIGDGDRLVGPLDGREAWVLDRHRRRLQRSPAHRRPGRRLSPRRAHARRRR